MVDVGRRGEKLSARPVHATVGCISTAAEHTLSLTHHAGEGGGVRSVCFAGGAPVPLKALKALGATLLDVNGQVSG